MVKIQIDLTNLTDNDVITLILVKKINCKLLEQFENSPILFPGV